MRKASAESRTDWSTSSRRYTGSPLQRKPDATEGGDEDRSSPFASTGRTAKIIHAGPVQYSTLEPVPEMPAGGNRPCGVMTLGRRIRVLIVDDSAIVRKILAETLARES